MSVRSLQSYVVRSLCVVFLLLLPFAAEGAQIRRAVEPVKDRYVVLLAAGTADVEATAKALAAKYDGRLLAVWKKAVQGFSIAMPAERAAKLAADARVKSIEEDAVLRPAAAGETRTGPERPPDGVPPVFPGDLDPLWHLTRISHRGLAPTTDETLIDFYSYRYTNDGQYVEGGVSKRIKVYLIDMGVWTPHREFANAFINSGVNIGRTPDKGPYPEPAPVDPSPVATNPCNGESSLYGGNAYHGTAVGSLIVGKNLGVAKGVELVPIQVASCADNTFVATAAMLIGGFEWVATHGQFPAVVNVSTYLFAGRRDFRCGNQDADCLTGLELTALETAVNQVVDQGFPVVVSANNQNQDACYTTPARLSRRLGRRNASGKRTGVITVGGTERTDRAHRDGLPPRDERWDTPTGGDNLGSNYGQCVDIFAPAGQMVAAFPLTTSSYVPAGQSSGTSYSAPIVTGMIARMMAADPALRVQDAETQERIWNALEANASPFAPANAGVASPNLLAYLGAVTFKSQPPPKIVAPANTSVTLSVAVVEPVTYQWYEGETLLPGQTAASLVVNVTAAQHANGTDYWVRARSTEHGAAFYADSYRINVRAGACARPKITQQPATVVRLVEAPTVPPPTNPPPIPPVQFVATVEADANLTYQWRWVRTDGTGCFAGCGDAEVPAGCVVASGTDTGTKTLTLTVPQGTAEVTTYQLLVTGACSDWKVCSDTAQMRNCALPAKPTVNATDGATSFGERISGTIEDRTKPVWYYSATPGGPFVPLRVEIPRGEMAAVAGERWVRYDTTSIVPPKPGWYALRAENGCGSSPLSDLLNVTQTCTFELQGKYPGRGRDFAGQLSMNSGFTAPVGTRVFLEARAFFGSNAPVTNPVTFTWSGNGTVSPDGKSFRTAPLTGGPVEVTVTASGSQCPPQTITFKLTGSATSTCPTPFRAWVGHCSREMDAVIAKPQNTIMSLQAFVTDVNGQVLSPELLSRVTYDWTITGADDRLEEVGNGAYADYVVGSYDQRIDVEVKLDGCTDYASLYIQAIPDVFCDANCTSACNHMRTPRYMRVNGVIATTYAITGGEQVTLSAPEIIAGATYEWYARSLDGTDTQVFAITPQVTIGPAESAEYWVVTYTNGERLESEHLDLIVNIPDGSTVTITPLSRVVAADTNTSFTANYSGATAATRYEWRHGPDKKLYRPVIGRDATLTVHADNDDSFWCRVIEPATATTPEAIYESGFAYLTVTCTNSVTGYVRVDVPRLQRNQRERINAFGRGKDLVYTWTRTYPNNPTPVVVEEWKPYLDPLPTQPVTYFNVTAVDSCGQSGDLGTVAIYLCVPTITQQPSGGSVAPGTPVPLTVAATPAIDGQPLSVAWYRSTDTARQTPLSQAWTFTPTVAAGTTESFYAAITSDCGGSPNVVTSQPATVSVCAAPSISTQPLSYWTRPGQQAYMSIDASGLDLTYQWYVGTSGTTSSPITNGGNASSITVTPSQTTSYWCKVTSQGLCSSNGATNTIKVCSPPSITAQPASVRVFANKTTLLSVTADRGSNTEPLSYRWQQQNSSGQWVDIGGATNATFTTPPYTVDITYRVIVATGTCETPSQAVTVSKCAYNEVVSGSEYKIGYNESVTLQLPTMSPVEYKTISWYRGDVGVKTNLMRTAVGTNLANPTGSLTQTTLYWAEFTHEGCVSRTSVYTVRVCKPEITTQPVGTTIRSGDPATLTAGVTAITGQTFQWYRGAVGNVSDPVAGATSASSPVTPTATTSYWLRVTGTCGLVADSNPVTIVVCNPPSISSVSPTRYIESGGQTTISVNATGSNLTYQWYVGQPGDTSVALSNGLTTGTSSSVPVAPNVTKTYWCKVTAEGLCSINSAAVIVDVCSDPTINTEPVSKVAFNGAPVTLSVAATGAGTLSYQWYQGASGVTSAPVSGQTGSSYTFNAATNTSYWCRVTTRVCTDDSAAATVTLCTYPELVAAATPERNTFAGESVSMSLPSMNPVEYKWITWYRGASGVKTNPLKSAEASNLTLTVSPEVTTQYWAEFTHNTCVSRTGTYTVNVCKPAITQHPPSAMIVQNNDTPTLTVVATGGGVTYQWYVGSPGDTSQPAPGASATTSSYTTLPLTNSTSYWVRVSGCNVTADSTASVITVCQTPAVSLTRTYNSTPGYTGTITATPTAGTNLTYQWYRGMTGDVSQPIHGAVNPDYSFTLSTSQYFWVRVTSGCNNTSVNSAHILYDVSPKITVQPQSTTIPYGGATTLSVTATGNYLTYQWYQNNVLIPGATSFKYTTPVLNANTSYRCRIYSGAAYVISDSASITMCSGPNISSFTISYQNGTTYELYAKVSSTHVLDVDYDWYSGVPGDPTQSTFLGPGNPKMTFWNVTTPRTIWVRVKFEDGRCYKDTVGYTIP